jgi:hypothetical protein
VHAPPSTVHATVAQVCADEHEPEQQSSAVVQADPDGAHAHVDPAPQTSEQQSEAEPQVAPIVPHDGGASIEGGASIADEPASSWWK